jgi:hypothetical protein
VGNGGAAESSESEEYVFDEEEHMQIILNSKVVFKNQVVFFMQPTVWSKNYKSCHSTPTPSPFLPPSPHNRSHNNLNCYTIAPIATSYAMILLLGLVDLQYF